MKRHIPSELYYTASHEWLRREGEQEAVIGITEHAQQLLGDMVFVELPLVGRRLDVGDDCAVAESVKAASDVYMPVAGEVTAINEELEKQPELINRDPYGGGWLFRVRLTEDSELEALLDAEAYRALLDAESD